MKSQRYQKRFYRDWTRAKDLHTAHILAKETDLQILTSKPIKTQLIEEKIRSFRWDIEGYIEKDHRFLTSLKPLAVELTAPAIVKEMSLQTSKVNVGPMASVAGAIAQFLGEELIKKGFRDVIVENGGDIFIKTSKTRFIGIYAGRSRLLSALCLAIKPKDTPLGICTSSGTIGHSLSFGEADSVVVLSRSAILADAIATATCNLIHSRADLQKALDFARSIKGVLGVVIIFRNNLLTWGKVEFVKRK
jgi:ApbE superfamily uncharacterized protein (UPF0280 family)